MNPEQLAAIAAAVQEHEQAAVANNRRLVSRLEAIPGGLEAFRRFLGTQGMSGAQIDTLLAGDVPVGALRGLLDLTIKDN